MFKIAADGTESVLYSFSGVDGGEPWAKLLIDSAGNFYGTTTSAGNSNVFSSGAVFKISPAGTETVLHFFIGGITDLSMANCNSAALGDCPRIAQQISHAFDLEIDKDVVRGSWRTTFEAIEVEKLVVILKALREAFLHVQGRSQ